MDFSKVARLAILLQVWASIGAAAPTQPVSNPNSASLNLINPGLSITPAYNSIPWNRSRQGNLHVHLAKILTLSSSTVLNASNHFFPDPHIIETRDLTIKYFDYRNTMDVSTGSRCWLEARRVAVRKVDAGQTDTAMGTDFQVWSSGNVYLGVRPEEQLTWGQWNTVLWETRVFAHINEFRGTHFRIRRRRIGDIIGRGYFLQQLDDTTVATNLSATTFPDPYDMHFYGLTIKFYDYRGSISPTAMEECIKAAYQDSARHIGRSEATMADPSYSYSAGGVNLFLTPGERLTWFTWSLIPRRIQQFVTENGFKGTKFWIFIDEIGLVGSGQIVSSTGAPTAVA